MRTAPAPMTNNKPLPVLVVDDNPVDQFLTAVHLG